LWLKTFGSKENFNLFSDYLSTMNTIANVNKGKLLNIQYNWTVNGVEIRGDLPARLTQGEAAEMLGLTQGDMRALKAAKLLFPLGNNPKKRRKVYNTACYSTIKIVRCMCDEKFMDEMQYAISEYNAKCNGRTL